MRLALAVLTVVSFAACGGSGGSTSDAMPCVEVGPSALKVLGLSSAGATVVTYEKSEGGLGRNDGKVWFVSSPEGATWVTSDDPAGDDFGGLILPLNAAARQASDVGADIPERAPIYRGIRDAEPGAVRSRECAKA